MVTNVDVVTVFNGRTDKETRRKKYIPTVITGVSYAEAKGATVANNGVWSDNVQYKIRIPMKAAVQDGRMYMPEPVYTGLNDGEAAKYWTVSRGDMVIRGRYDGDGPVLYEDGVIKYAQAHGADLIHVTEYADDTFGGSPYMRHWRIGGK